MPSPTMSATILDKNGGMLYQNSGLNATGLGGVLGGLDYGGPPANTWANLNTSMGVKPPGPRQQDPTGQYGFNSTSPWTNVNGAVFNAGVPNANGQMNGAVGGGAGGAGGGAYSWQNPYQSQILSLLARQEADNAWARRNNENNWMMARDQLLGIQGFYDNDATTNATRGRVNQLLADPEAINDRVQNMILAKNANMIDGQTNAQMRRAQGVLGASGQLDASSIMAAQERLGRAGMAQRASTASALEIERAARRNQDIQNAIAAGGAQSMRDIGVRQNIANTLISNLPQYKADDYSGMVAALGSHAQAAAMPAAASLLGPLQGAQNPSPYGYNAGVAPWSFGTGEGGGINYSDRYGDRLPQQGGARRGSIQALGWDTTGTI